MDTGKKLRLRRFFKKGRTIIIPIDHALYGGPSKGIEDLRELIVKIADSKADGILISPGMLENFSDILKNLAIVLRIDGTHTRLGSHLERIDLITTVEDASKLGADMVVVNVFVGTDNEDYLLKKLGLVATVCRERGMPLMGEMLPLSILNMHFGKGGDKFFSQNIVEDLKLVSRLGAEIGADVIKTHYTGTIDSFKEVVKTTPIPILIAGGPKTDTDEGFVRQVKDALTAGARGICIGRNVWMRNDIIKMIEALSSIIHEDPILDK